MTPNPKPATDPAPAAPASEPPRRHLAACPTCGSAIPPDWGGLIRQRDLVTRVGRTYAYWCGFCNLWWIVYESRTKRGPGRRVSNPRRASEVEADCAVRRIFTANGRYVPGA